MVPATPDQHRKKKKSSGEKERKEKKRKEKRSGYRMFAHESWWTSLMAIQPESRNYKPSCVRRLMHV